MLRLLADYRYIATAQSSSWCMQCRVILGPNSRFSHLTSGLMSE